MGDEIASDQLRSDPNIGGLGNPGDVPGSASQKEEGACKKRTRQHIVEVIDGGQEIFPREERQRIKARVASHCIDLPSDEVCWGELKHGLVRQAWNAGGKCLIEGSLRFEDAVKEIGVGERERKLRI